VSFFDGSTNIGSTGVIGGSATTTVTLTGDGDHLLSASFTPLDATAFLSSMTAQSIDYFVVEPSPAPTPTPTPTPVSEPLVIVSPALQGLGVVGSYETCLTGSFSGATSFTFTFTINGKTIQGPSATTRYTLKQADLAKTISCTVTATGPGGVHPVQTQSVHIGLGRPIKPVKATSISGSARVGQTLKLKLGTWSVKPARYAYQWKRNGKSISHATKSSYKLVAADRGAKITCTITAYAVAYAHDVVTTKSVKAI
jgi:hypothetical protein